MKTRIALIALILAASGTIGLLAGEVIEEIVAIVNDEIITLSQYKEYHDSLVQVLRSQFQGEEFEKQYAQMKSGIMDNLVTELLVLQLAKEKALNVNEQVRATVQKIMEENNIESEEQLRREMSRQGVDYDQFLKQIEENLLRQAVIFTEVDRVIAVDESEGVNYYKLHQEEFIESEEYKLRAIYLSPAAREGDNLEALKQEISAKLDAGEDLAALSAEYSDSPLNQAQGDLGVFKKGELDKDLEKAVETLQAGELTPWVQAKNGWYILKLEEKKEARLKSFEEVKKSIEEKIYNERRNQRIREFLKDLREKAYIKILKPIPLGD